MRYDAHKAPDPGAWLEDESERIDAVIAYHKRVKEPVGQDKKLHAIAHVIVESQAAMGDVTLLPATLAWLMREGLDRHDAIQAIASILMGIVFDAAKSPEVDINAAYGRELAALTAASWRAQ
jgi:hypothetical protein